MSVIQGQNSAQNTKTDPVTQHTVQYFGLQGTKRSQNIIMEIKSIHFLNSVLHDLCLTQFGGTFIWFSS